MILVKLPHTWYFWQRTFTGSRTHNVREGKQVAKMTNLANWYSEVSGAIHAMSAKDAERELKKLVPFRGEFDRIVGTLSPELRKLQAVILKMRDKVIAVEAERCELARVSTTTPLELTSFDETIAVAEAEIKVLTDLLRYFVRCEVGVFRAPLIVLYGGQVATVAIQRDQQIVVSHLDDPAAPTQVEATVVDYSVDGVCGD